MAIFSLLFWLVLVALLLAIYFLPTIVATFRRHPSAVAIFFLNLLLGWTILGWVGAFVWAFTSPAQVVINNQVSQSIADEIQKLANLKEQGLLTEDEFSIKKQQILSKV